MDWSDPPPKLHIGQGHSAPLNRHDLIDAPDWLAFFWLGRWGARVNIYVLAVTFTIF